MIYDAEQLGEIGEDGVRWHLAPDGGEDGRQHGDGQGAPGEDQRVSGQ